MRAYFLLFALLLLPYASFAQNVVVDDQEIETAFEQISELGTPSKPTQQMFSTQAAYDFIIADKIVRKGIEDKIEQGYADWKVTSKLMGYDGNEPVFEVRVSASNQLPPYLCVYRFDSVGNDRRERPWTGCGYE